MRRAALLGALLLAACAAPPPSAPEGPLFDGQPLSHWLQEVKDLHPDRRNAALRALTYYGADAAPAIPDVIRSFERNEYSESRAAEVLRAVGRPGLDAAEAAMFHPS